MSITPMSPAISQQGWVQTWVTSQWKNRPIPGQFSAEINIRRDYRASTPEAERDRWSVGVKLTVPLVDLSTVAEISAAKQLASAEKYRALDTRRTVKTQFSNMWDDYQASRENLQNASVRVQAQRKVAAASLARYRQGMTTLRDALEDQRSLTAAELDALQLKVRMTYAICQILLTADAFDTAMLSG